MARTRFGHIERIKKHGYRREEWKKHTKETVRQATGEETPGRILHQQRQQLDQATGGEILDGSPDITGTRSKKLLRSMRRKKQKQLRQAFGDAIPGDTPAEDTDGQQEAGE